MTYTPATILAVCGAVLLTFGIHAPSDGATIGGVVFGTMIAGSGVMLAYDAWCTRWQVRDNVRANLRRTLDRIDRTRDRSHEPPRAARHYPPDRWIN